MASTNEEEPMFSLAKFDYSPSKRVKQMVVASNVIAIATEAGHLILTNAEQPEDIQDIEISKQDKIHQIFLDPHGKHLLLSLENGDNYLLNTQSRPARPKLIQRLKPLVFNAVAWDRSNPETSTTTGDILLGSTKGGVFEAILDSKEGKEKLFKPLYTLTEENGKPIPICNLFYERAPLDTGKYFVVLTTSNKVYQFANGESFEKLFEPRPSISEFGAPNPTPKFEIVSYLNNDRKYHQVLPTHYAWLTGSGILAGTLAFSPQGGKIITDPKMLSYPPSSLPASTQPHSPAPNAIAITMFHFLLLYPDRFQAICRLSHKIDYEYSFNKMRENQQCGFIKGLCYDVTQQRVWGYSDDRLIFEVDQNRPNRNWWSLFLQQNNFDEAERYAYTPAQKQQIVQAHASYLFSQGDFQGAAKKYAQSSAPFEEIALKLVQEDPSRQGLKTFLTIKLSKLASTGQKNTTQLQLVATWLLDIYLTNLHRDPEIKKEFISILDKIYPYLIPSTTYELLSSHGRIDLLLQYARLSKDYEKVVSYQIQQGEFEETILSFKQAYNPALLGAQPDYQLLYKYAPILMQTKPYKTVNLLCTFQRLEVKKLLPALMRYEDRFYRADLLERQSKGEKFGPEETENQAIRYLRYCVTNLKTTEAAAHNFLVYLYAKQPDEKPLMDFLKLTLPPAKNYYEIKSALRVCTKHNKQRACILIYSAMGLYEEALDLALKIEDIELAQETAIRLEDDKHLKKKLWLKIAQHVIGQISDNSEQKPDISRAMNFLEKSELKIEDILPFFKDFSVIDDFKKEICDSLEDYNSRINKLIQVMNEATKSADLIRVDIKNLRYRYGVFNATKGCELCNYPLLNQQFYYFPCQHAYHASCLNSEISNPKANDLLMQIELEQRRIAREHHQNPDEIQNERLNQLKGELDSLLASECLQCGDRMIESIGLPFIDPEKDREAVESWNISHQAERAAV